MYQEDRSVSYVTWKQRDDRYNLNQLIAEPWIPNEDERRVIMVNSVESSREVEFPFCCFIACMEVNSLMV